MTGFSDHSESSVNYGVTTDWCLCCSIKEFLFYERYHTRGKTDDPPQSDVFLEV